ncbi:MAG: molybdenum cofactor guanylyltransferase [Alkalispirochaeta sp.]
MNAIVLAGGKSTRFLSSSVPNKAFLQIGDRTIIESIISSLYTVFDRIWVVAGENEAFYRLKQVYGDIEVIEDKIPGKNSLAGIYSGLIDSDSMYNFVIAWDMPFMNTELIRYLMKASGGYDVTVPVIDGYFDGLHAIYSKNCIPFIERQLSQNNLKVIDFFNNINLKTVPERTVRLFDPDLLAFINVNKRDEYRRALEIDSGVMGDTSKKTLTAY